MKKQIVNKSKENWVKVFNSLEGELNLEYSINVLLYLTLFYESMIFL